MAHRAGRTDVETQVRSVSSALAKVLAAYDDVLADASLLTTRVPLSPPPSGRAWAFFARVETALSFFNFSGRRSRPFRARRAFRALVRSLCESHMRRRLGRVETALVQFLHALPSAQPTDRDRATVAAACDDVRAFRASLAGWGPFRRIVAAAGSFTAGLFVAGFGGDNIFEAALAAARAIARMDLAWMLVGAGVTFFASQILLMRLSSVFEAKRDLFFPEWRLAEASESVREKGTPLSGMTWLRDRPSARNVYALEDDLFAALRRTKPREVALDHLVIGGGLLLWCAAAVVVAVADSPWYLVAAALFGSFALTLVVAGRRRTVR